ncbi:hypothetical protein [Streptomyces sp. NRRL F-5135]|nr:hypothetical protein [Streptomyces sp. NRRL F-5135]
MTSLATAAILVALGYGYGPSLTSGADPEAQRTTAPTRATDPYPWHKVRP